MQIHQLLLIVLFNAMQPFAYVHYLYMYVLCSGCTMHAHPASSDLVPLT
jgi:hypothetical protein